MGLGAWDDGEERRMSSMFRRMNNQQSRQRPCVNRDQQPATQQRSVPPHPEPINRRLRFVRKRIIELEHKYEEATDIEKQILTLFINERNTIEQKLI